MRPSASAMLLGTRFPSSAVTRVATTRAARATARHAPRRRANTAPRKLRKARWSFWTQRSAVKMWLTDWVHFSICAPQEVKEDLNGQNPMSAQCLLICSILFMHYRLGERFVRLHASGEDSGNLWSKVSEITSFVSHSVNPAFDALIEKALIIGKLQLR